MPIRRRISGRPSNPRVLAGCASRVQAGPNDPTLSGRSFGAKPVCLDRVSGALFSPSIPVSPFGNSLSANDAQGSTWINSFSVALVDGALQRFFNPSVDVPAVANGGQAFTVRLSALDAVSALELLFAQSSRWYLLVVSRVSSECASCDSTLANRVNTSRGAIVIERACPCPFS